jgi:predicted RNase H-like nuclease (RuvC/YqgF family)
MQQDTEDRKHEVIVKGLEDKIKEFEASLKEKDILMQTAEGSLAEVQSQNAKLSEVLDESSRCFNRETKELEAKVKAETERNSKLHEAFENLRNKCADFATRCANRLKRIFNSVGAVSKEINPSAEDIPGAFDHIENEVEALDEVITSHVDFCTLVASRGTTAAFMKAGCTHAKMVNEPTFNLSTSDIVDVPAETRSIGNRFITQIWAKGGRELAGDEARKVLNSV